MIARIVFWILAALWLIGGIWGDVQAKTALQQILAQMDYLIAAVFMVGAEICGAMYGSTKTCVANGAAAG